MSATISHRYLMARGTSAFLNYLHVDVVVAFLALLFVFAGGVANSTDVLRSIEASIPELSLPAEAATPARDVDRVSLTPTMGAALESVVQRYRVSPEALLPVFEAAQAAGRARHLDPLLIIAVIAIESRFNPFSQSSMGAQGLMQIIPRYHPEKLPAAAAGGSFLDPVGNVHAGARILQEAVQRNGGLVEGLQFYAGALDDPEQGYANKVLAEKLRLEQAARRKIGANA